MKNLEINPEQVAYIKSLDCSKKRKEFLLTAIVENIIGEPEEISELPSQKYVFTPNGLVPMSKEFSDLIDSGKTHNWYNKNAKEVEEKFNELANNFVLKENPKKYTEEDMRKCFEAGNQSCKFHLGYKHIDFNDYINSLKNPS
jgi:hypothetical protein